MDIKIEEECKKKEGKLILDYFHNAFIMHYVVYYKQNFQNIL